MNSASSVSRLGSTNNNIGASSSQPILGIAARISSIFTRLVVDSPEASADKEMLEKKDVKKITDLATFFTLEGYDRQEIRDAQTKDLEQVHKNIIDLAQKSIISPGKFTHEVLEEGEWPTAFSQEKIEQKKRDDITAVMDQESYSRMEVSHEEFDTHEQMHAQLVEKMKGEKQKQHMIASLMDEELKNRQAIHAEESTHRLYFPQKMEHYGKQVAAFDYGDDDE